MYIVLLWTWVQENMQQKTKIISFTINYLHSVSYSEVVPDISILGSIWDYGTTLNSYPDFPNFWEKTRNI